MFQSKKVSVSSLIDVSKMITRGTTSAGKTGREFKVTDLTGKKFGQLTVKELLGYASDGRTSRTPLWKCVCSCGNEVERTYKVLMISLNRGDESVCSHVCKNRSRIVNKKEKYYYYVRKTERKVGE